MENKIGWVDAALKTWGRLACIGADGGTGWWKESPMFRERVGQGSYRSTNPFTVTEAEFHRIDCAVHKLPDVLKIVCISYYKLNACNARATAKQCGIASNSVGKYINQIYPLIDRAMQECGNDSHLDVDKTRDVRKYGGY